MICNGYSQRTVTEIINVERAANGLTPFDRSPIDRQRVKEAEARIQLVRRKRRKQKAGSTDLEGDWAKASLGQSLQLLDQMERGERQRLALMPEYTIGPPLDIHINKTVNVCDGDIWGVIGQEIKVLGKWWGLKGPGGAKRYSCKLLRYVHLYEWTPTEKVGTYIIKHGDEPLYPMREVDVRAHLSPEVRVRLDKEDAAAPPFVIEQVLILDETHERCHLGKSSEFDCLMPFDTATGDWCAVEDGGEYGDWTDTTCVKFPKEVRLLLGVMVRRDGNDVLVGDRMKPFEYTNKWIVGIKKFEKFMQLEIDRANHLKGGGGWASTKGYSAAQLATLPGGRYEARLIETTGKGDGWQAEVKEVVGRGEAAKMVVTDLMDHAIAEGNRLFADTPYKDTWILFHDHLSSWWEVEAREYLAAKGFKDRQVRAYGDTNIDFPLYHESLVGNRPEMCAMDFHLNSDFKMANRRHVIGTSHLPIGDIGRYDNGTPKELSSSLHRTWLTHPTNERIAEDVTRLEKVLKMIIKAQGGVVPDVDLRSGRRGARAKRPFVPNKEVGVAMVQRSKQLRATAKAMKSE